MPNLSSATTSRRTALTSRPKVEARSLIETLSFFTVSNKLRRAGVNTRTISDALSNVIPFDPAIGSPALIAVARPLARLAQPSNPSVCTFVFISPLPSSTR